MVDFAALEARINRVAATHVANASAVFEAGEVRVCFSEARATLPLDRPAPRIGRQWTIAAPAEDFAAVSPAKGGTVTVNALSFELVDVDVDVTGWTIWNLRKAS
jgi:hypothetical protein